MPRIFGILKSFSSTKPFCPAIIKGKSAEKIAEEIIAKFGSFKGMANQPFEKFHKIKGLADVKIIKIAAAFEISRRIVKEVLKENEK